MFRSLTAAFIFTAPAVALTVGDAATNNKDVNINVKVNIHGVDQRVSRGLDARHVLPVAPPRGVIQPAATRPGASNTTLNSPTLPTPPTAAIEPGADSGLFKRGVTKASMSSDETMCNQEAEAVYKAAWAAYDACEQAKYREEGDMEACDVKTPSLWTRARERCQDRYDDATNSYTSRYKNPCRWAGCAGWCQGEQGEAGYCCLQGEQGDLRCGPYDPRDRDDKMKY